jgi:hypothetical protein
VICAHCDREILDPRKATDIFVGDEMKPVHESCQKELFTYEVEMLAFGGGAIREVELPSTTKWDSDPELLNAIFMYGQNDFQPRPFPSVSVGDVIRLPNAKYRVESFGFNRVDPPNPSEAKGQEE